MLLPGTDNALDYVDGYDEEIAYTDFHLDRFMSAFSEMANPDRALVIFTADHGESMMERDKWFRHRTIYDEAVRVPLLVRSPDLRAGERTEPTSTLDIAPTVLGFTGSPVPQGLLGLDLLSVEQLDPSRPIFFEAANGGFLWRAEQRGSLKWVVKIEQGTGEIAQQLLYDLAVDALEESPLPWSAREERPHRLLALCRADPDPGGLPQEYAQGRRLREPKVSDRAGEKALAGLRALGYVE